MKAIPSSACIVATPMPDASQHQDRVSSISNGGRSEDVCGISGSESVGMGASSSASGSVGTSRLVSVGDSENSNAFQDSLSRNDYVSPEVNRIQQHDLFCRY